MRSVKGHHVHRLVVPAGSGGDRGLRGIRVAPVYLNYMKVKAPSSRPQSEYAAAESTNRELIAVVAREALRHRRHRFSERSRTSAIRESGESWVMRSNYEDIVPLFGNVSLLVQFDKSVTIADGHRGSMRPRSGRLPGCASVWATSRATRSCSRRRLPIAAPEQQRATGIPGRRRAGPGRRGALPAFPQADEGDLSRLRSRLVSAGPLAGSARSSASATCCSWVVAN